MGGPIAPANVSVIARKDLSASISTAADFAPYVVGVVDQDIAHIALMEMGARPKFVYNIESPFNAIRMLERGRIQMWASGTMVTFWLIRTQGYDPRDYEVVYNLADSDYYFAIHKETDDRLVSALGRALDGIRADGTLARIHERYVSGSGGIPLIGTNE